MQDMTSGSPLKLILKFSIPLLIGNIFQQMYSISDIIIVGRLIGVDALAAVGVCAPLFFMLVVISIGFTNGLTVITAQRFGAHDHPAVRRSVATATILSLLFTFSTSILMLLFLDILFCAMNVPQEIYQDAKDFITIISYGVSTIVIFNLLSGFLRAIGDSKTPLYFLIFSTILNISLNIILIYHYHLGVRGSALGTVCSMFIAVICCLGYIYKRFPQIIPLKQDWKLKYNFCKQHLAIALPMALQFSIIAISTTIIQSVCNTFGPDTIAAFISALRVEQLAMQPLISVGIAISTYVAQNFGAGMIARIRRGVYQGFFISLYSSIILAFLIGFFGPSIIAIFVSDTNQNIIQIGQTYLTISVLFYFFLGQIFLFRNALQGMGNATIPLISSIIELLLRILAVLYLAPKFGYLGICYASPIAWIGGSLIVFIGYIKMLRYIGKRYQFRRPKVFSRIHHIKHQPR